MPMAPWPQPRRWSVQGPAPVAGAEAAMDAPPRPRGGRGGCGASPRRSALGGSCRSPREPGVRVPGRPRTPPSAALQRGRAKRVQRAQKGDPSGLPASGGRGCGSGCALLPAPGDLGEVGWPRPVPPRSQEPAPGDTARSIVRDRRAATLSQLRSLPRSLQEGLQRKKKLFGKRQNVQEPTWSRQDSRQEALRAANPTCAGHSSNPPTPNGPSRPRSLPRGARQLCPTPPRTGGLPKSPRT